jgi:Zn-dependent alcohol dehydrogenase
VSAAESGGATTALLGATLALDEINEGFDRLHDGSALRQIVRFS